MRCFARFGTILKLNVKNTHGGLLLLVKLQANTAPCVFFTFLKIVLMVPNSAKHNIVICNGLAMTAR